MSKAICGVVVDEKKYREVYAKSYFISGVNCAFDYVELGVAVLNGTESARGLATDTVFCENCKRIYDKTRAELISYNKAKGLNEQGKEICNMTEGDLKTMKHENFGGYLQDLKELFLRASREREALKQKFDKAGETWKREEVETRGNEYEHTRAHMDFLEAEETYKNGVLELEKKYKKAVEDVRAEFESHVDDFYAPNGNRIDTATVSLLNSGIKLSAAELDKLLVQFCDNPTMLRVLGDYSNKNGLNKESRATAYSHTAKGYGAEEKRIFNRVANFVNSTVGVDERRFWTWNEKGRNDSAEMIDGAIAEMDGYFVRPQVSGE